MRSFLLIAVGFFICSCLSFSYGDDADQELSARVNDQSDSVVESKKENDETIRLNNSVYNHPQALLETRAFCGEGRGKITPERLSDGTTYEYRIDREKYVTQNVKLYARYYLASPAIKAHYGSDGFILWFNGDLDGKEIKIKQDGKTVDYESYYPSYMDFSKYNKIPQSMRKAYGYNADSLDFYYCKIIPEIQVEDGPHRYGMAAFITYDDFDALLPFTISFRIFSGEGLKMVNKQFVIDPEFGLVEYKGD